MLGTLSSNTVIIVCSHLTPWDLVSFAQTCSKNAALFRQVSTWMTMFRHHFMKEQHEPWASRILEYARQEYIWLVVTERRLVGDVTLPKKFRGIARKLSRKHCEIPGCGGRHFTRKCNKSPCLVCGQTECDKVFLTGKFYQCEGPCRAFRSKLLRCGRSDDSWRQRSISVSNANLRDSWRCTGCDHPFDFKLPKEYIPEGPAEKDCPESLKVADPVFAGDPVTPDLHHYGLLFCPEPIEVISPDSRVSFPTEKQYLCSWCNAEILGTRYKCANCVEYLEICHKCWSADDSHETVNGHLFLVFRGDLTDIQRRSLPVPILPFSLSELELKTGPEVVSPSRLEVEPQIDPNEPDLWFGCSRSFSDDLGSNDPAPTLTPTFAIVEADSPNDGVGVMDPSSASSVDPSDSTLLIPDLSPVSDSLESEKRQEVVSNLSDMGLLGPINFNNPNMDDPGTTSLEAPGQIDFGLPAKQVDTTSLLLFPEQADTHDDQPPPESTSLISFGLETL